MAVKIPDKYKKKHAPKRSFKKIRKELLTGLSSGHKNINELSQVAEVNWRTTSQHLIYLIGMSYAKEVFRSSQVRIYEITERGMEVLAKNEI